MPACLSPFFLIMKLEPMKMEELTARAKPLAWSDDQRPPCTASRLTPAASFVPVDPSGSYVDASNDGR